MNYDVEDENEDDQRDEKECGVCGKVSKRTAGWTEGRRTAGHVVWVCTKCRKKAKT
jgi:hypothetical protein